MVAAVVSPCTRFSVRSIAPDPRHDLRRDARRIRSFRCHRERQDGEERRPDGDQDVRAEARALLAHFTFRSEESAQEGREQQAPDQFCVAQLEHG
jgi:hypothetical protein